MGQSNQPLATMNQIYNIIKKAIVAGASILFISSDRERAIQFMLQSIEQLLMTDYTGITLFLTDDADTPLVHDFCRSPKMIVNLIVGDNRLLRVMDFHKMRLLLLSSLPETRFGE